MAELFCAGELLDAELAAALGPVDDATSDAITGICNDALEGILGSATAAALQADHRLLPLIAPWARDLARGLQFQSQHGPAEPDTTELLTRLSADQITGGDARRFADTVDRAAVLTLGRVLEQVLGPGAGARDPRENESAAPWLTGLKLGYRIYLAQELLRLL